MALIFGTACFLRKEETRKYRKTLLGFLRKEEAKKDRKTLLLYRNRGKNDMHQGHFVAPGGKVESGERSLDCIIREYKEETGLRIIVPKLKVIATICDKGKPDWLVNFYEASLFRGYLKTEHEKDKLVWVLESEILNPKSKIKMYEGDRKLFNLIKGEGLFEVILKYDGEKLLHFNYQRVH